MSSRPERTPEERESIFRDWLRGFITEVERVVVCADQSAVTLDQLSRHLEGEKRAEKMLRLAVTLLVKEHGGCPKGEDYLCPHEGHCVMTDEGCWFKYIREQIDKQEAVRP